MAEIDASIYGDLKQPDPLGMMKDVNTVEQGMLSNTLARRNLEAQQQMGKAVQEATDPETGQVDTKKLGEILKRPENWLAATEGGKYGVDLRSGQAAAETAGIGTSDAAWKNLGTVWGARAAQTRGDISPDDLRDDVLDLWARDGLGDDPARLKKILRLVPSDPKKARAFATGGFLQALGPLGVAAPAPATPGARGEPRQQTGGQFVTQSLGGNQPEEMPSLNPDMGLGSTPATEPAKPAAPATPKSPSGVTTGVGLTTEANVKATNDLAALSRQTRDRKGILDNMLSDQELFTGGPASDELKTFIAGVNEIFGTKFDVERVAAQERFDKLANQIALTQAGSLGITDDRVATAMGANPNSKMSNLGIQGNIALLKGNEDAIQAKDEAWNDALDATQFDGVPILTVDDFGRFSRLWNRHFDPRVFQSVYMDPMEWKQMVSKLPKDSRNKLRSDYNYAVEHGWIPDPRRQ